MDKIVTVTGGLSGIGKATVKQLYEKGYIVIIADCKEIDNNYLSENFEDLNRIFFYKVDISKKEQIYELRDFIKNKFGKLDCLVNDAGIIPLPCGIEDITDENISKTIDVNLKGTFYCLKILGSLIKETSLKGSIVNLTSVDGIIGEPYGVIYSATKAGIISLTKSFARYYNNPNIRVNAVAPGLIDTPLTESTGEDPSWTIDFSIIKRIGKPEEIANAIYYLLSEKSSFITGQILTVDGGFTLK